MSGRDLLRDMGARFDSPEAYAAAVKRMDTMVGDSPTVDTIRKVLNDYDAFVAFREDEGREVTLRDRHDWADRWVARLRASDTDR